MSVAGTSRIGGGSFIKAAIGSAVKTHTGEGGGLFLDVVIQTPPLVNYEQVFVRWFGTLDFEALTDAAVGSLEFNHFSLAFEFVGQWRVVATREILVGG